jgi:hypothetical protein
MASWVPLREHLELQAENDRLIAERDVLLSIIARMEDRVRQRDEAIDEVRRLCEKYRDADRGRGRDDSLPWEKDE